MLDVGSKFLFAFPAGDRFTRLVEEGGCAALVRAHLDVVSTMYRATRGHADPETGGPGRARRPYLSSASRSSRGAGQRGWRAARIPPSGPATKVTKVAASRQT